LDSNKLQRILNLINGVQWISFTSTAGVAYFFSALWAAGLDLRRLNHLRFAAVGPATARALGERGIRADYVPEVYDTPHLARGLAERAKGEGVLLLRSAQGSPELPSILREAGVPFEDVAIYETVTSSQSDPLLLDWLSEGEVLVTFTSGSTVRGFVEGLPVGTDLSRVRGVSIGEQTAAECRQYGISTLVAPEATERGLIDLITSAFCERSE
jgi:uroporphyrinogen III methyltransferase/synthase